MKRHGGWSMLIGLLLILGIVGLAAAEQPRYGGTLRVAWESELTGFDPHWSPGLQVWYMAGNLIEFKIMKEGVTRATALRAGRSENLAQPVSETSQKGGL